LRINPDYDKEELLKAMEELCASEEGRIKLKEYIKNKEGEIEIYSIALEALESVASLNRFPTVLARINSEDVSDRILALEETGFLRGDLNVLRIPVQNCLTDTDPQVRSTALNILPRIFPTEAGDILSNVLVTEKDQNVVLHAGRVLSQVATLDFLPELEKLLSIGSRPVTRLAAAHVVSAMKEKPPVSWVENNVLPEIWDLLGPSKKASDRAGAAALLSRFTKTYGSNLDPAVKETLDSMVQSEKDPWVSTFLLRAQNGFGF
ncbi:MAG: HEAT repeat domain-containing protein, partial [Planctomycetota bacterium]|nr:HEAT repeat domain-containing protein [Planctomycetota bacterium]